jgi:hypothetical protein
MIMDDIIRKLTEGQENGLWKIMVYADCIVIWESNESSLEKKFQKVITVCKYFGLKANLDKCVVKKMSWKPGGMEKIKCNNYEIKEVESFKYSI